MRTQNPRFRLAATVAVTALLLSQVLPQPAMAQGAPPPLRPAGAQDQQGGDPPTRVGRLAQLSGTVSFHAQDEDQWNPATLNFPVVQGNAFWTEPNAQAVIEVSASRIAMAPGTELDVATLTDTAFQATAAAGRTLSPRPRGDAGRDLCGADAAGSGHAHGAGPLWRRGRRHPEPDHGHGDRRRGARRGSGRFARRRSPTRWRASPAATRSRARSGRRSATPSSPRCSPASARRSRRPSRRRLRWRRCRAATTWRRYGSWSDSPDYGQVWYPQVAQDWVPYREGRWAYVAPWGWTWVDNAPWGFAPFHYGRWVEAGGRWGWIPGVGVGRAAAGLCARAGDLPRRRRGSRHRYRRRAGRRPGRLVPLGPREPFHPWYRASDRYFRQVNVTHVDQLHHHQPQCHDQQLRQSPRGDGRADQRDDRLASGGELVPAGRSGAACAGAAGDRPAAAAPGTHHRRRDAGGRAPVGLAAVVAEPAH